VTMTHCPATARPRGLVYKLRRKAISIRLFRSTTMRHRISKGLLPAGVLLLLSSINAVAQSQTTGRIAGTVEDQNGAVIAGAEVTTASSTTGADRKVTTDATGNYAVPSLPPGTYRVRVTASGFHTLTFDVEVVITQTTTLNVDLPLAGLIDTVVVPIAPLIQRDGPQLGRVVDSRAVTELPLATRNFTQILGLSPWASVAVRDNTAVG